MSQHNLNTVGFDVDALEIFGGESERGTPERNLLMAILERAILDFVGNDQKEVGQAEEWLFEDDKSANEDEVIDAADFDSASYGYTPFSFSWVCQQLDLDRSFVAETIKAMPKRGHRRVAPWYFMKQAG
ncbi:MAG: hypothetical protein KDD70_16295 [Bdellovibrionales bacterium]|nr:hypothetical protein [Bdellovibrionales bacterium]